MRTPGPDARTGRATAHAKPGAAAQPSRICVVHDWLDTWAGGEQCLAQILSIYPAADLFALVDFFPDAYRARIGGRRATTSFVQRLPGARGGFRRYLPLFPAAIERLDVSAYDVVISSSHAVAKGVRTRADQLHVCYCYSPIRYAWDLRDQYLGQVGLDRGVRGWAAARLLDRIQRWDRRTSDRVTTFVAISQHIARRIERCYGRSAQVVYPPVDVQPAPSPPGAREVYVTVSRLVPYKRIDAIVRAFGRLRERELVVIGEGPERRRIEALAPPNVRMLGLLPDAERDAWLAKARAFVFAAEEDFGIAPVEALAHGTPVIAFDAGGMREVVAGLESERPTGAFFAEQTPEAIAEAVQRFEEHASCIDPAECRRSAATFSPQRFRDAFASLVAAEWTAFAEARSR